MEPMTIEDMLARMAELEKSFRPLLAKAKTEKEEYSQLEQAIEEMAIREGLIGENAFNHGVVKVNPGKPALALIPGKKGSASWEEAAVRARKEGLHRFVKKTILDNLIKDRVKHEMSDENMKKIGVQVVTEPSVKVEVF